MERYTLAEFKVHRLNEEGIKQVNLLAEKFDDLASYLLKMQGADHDRLKTCLQKLEEACFFAKKHLASNEAFQER